MFFKTRFLTRCRRDGETAIPEKRNTMSISEFCNRNVIGVAGDTPVIEAAALMRQHHVGDVIVVEEVHGQRKPVAS